MRGHGEDKRGHGEDKRGHGEDKRGHGEDERTRGHGEDKRGHGEDKRGHGEDKRGHGETREDTEDKRGHGEDKRGQRGQRGHGEDKRGHVRTREDTVRTREDTVRTREDTVRTRGHGEDKRGHVKSFPLVPGDLSWLFATRSVFLYPELLPSVSLDPALYCPRRATPSLQPRTGEYESRPGPDRGQTGARPGPDRGQTRRQREICWSYVCASHSLLVLGLRSLALSSDPVRLVSEFVLRKSVVQVRRRILQCCRPGTRDNVVKDQDNVVKVTPPPTHTYTHRTRDNVVKVTPPPTHTHRTQDNVVKAFRFQKRVWPMPKACAPQTECRPLWRETSAASPVDLILHPNPYYLTSFSTSFLSSSPLSMSPLLRGERRQGETLLSSSPSQSLSLRSLPVLHAALRRLNSQAPPPSDKPRPRSSQLTLLRSDSSGSFPPGSSFPPRLPKHLLEFRRIGFVLLHPPPENRPITEQQEEEPVTEQQEEGRGQRRRRRRSLTSSCVCLTLKVSRPMRSQSLSRFPMSLSGGRTRTPSMHRGRAQEVMSHRGAWSELRTLLKVIFELIHSCWSNLVLFFSCSSCVHLPPSPPTCLDLLVLIQKIKTQNSCLEKKVAFIYLCLLFNKSIQFNTLCPYLRLCFVTTAINLQTPQRHLLHRGISTYCMCEHPGAGLRRKPPETRLIQLKNKRLSTKTKETEETCFCATEATEADRELLLAVQKGGANQKTFRSVSSSLGNKTTRQVQLRFRDLMTLFYSSNHRAAPCSTQEPIRRQKAPD
ncbi:hypothetical protein WMY93_004371 [Mugilogobius chulae]|uniref:Myb-like domain-containing protein n=1 Tax=Mugilogobius chulae TaxID=88201 RepID=A0AAW0PND6_9GOBI